ncbi:MAG: Uma2 family endonuclease [Myxococcota bacterium]
MPDTAVTRRPPRLIYEVTDGGEDWALTEDKVPESRPHERRSERVFAQLDFMVERTGRDALVCRNLAVRWDESRPRIGVDPDVCLLEPAPPEGDELPSLRLWRPGHHPPLVAVEIVSPSRADKDYAQSPLKYATNGTRELWVFDPMLAGPRDKGGPYRLAIWQRNDNGDFLRVYTGDGPARSDALDAWIFAVDEGRSLRIADDEAGTSWWTTREEAAELRAERFAEKLRALGVDPDSLL